MSTYNRWKKLAPKSSMYIGGVWGTGDEGPPCGCFQVFLNGKIWNRLSLCQKTTDWYCVSLIKLSFKALCESICVSTAIRQKSINLLVLLHEVKRTFQPIFLANTD